MKRSVLVNIEIKRHVVTNKKKVVTKIFNVVANIFITSSGRFKIGDFGMASLWPRPGRTDATLGSTGSGIDSSFDFEREGDKVYLAAEVLRGQYGKETDIFR